MTADRDRRCFLKRLGMAGAGVIGSTAIGLLAKENGADAPKLLHNSSRPLDFRKGLADSKPLLAVGRGEPVQATKAAIGALGGMSRFVLKGEKVVIKPNVAWDRAPIHAANTNPLVVATLVEMCLKAGAGKVQVTDNTCNEAERCFTRSGIWKAVEAAGGEVILPAEHRFAPRDLGGVLGTCPSLLPVLEADRLINVAIAKHHGLSGFTGAMKNLYGVIGGRRNRLHQNIDESIVDLAASFRATLTVLDATRVLLRNGPQGGDVSDTREVGQVMASTDPVAVDAYACTLVDIKPEELPYLAMASRRGLGMSAPDAVERREVS